MIVEHLNDDRSRETADKLFRGSYNSNMKSFHAARETGLLPANQLVSRRIPRWICRKLAQLTGLKGAKLESYIAHLLRLEILRLES